MPAFEYLFLESKGQPVEYNGQTIQMVDRVAIPNGQKLKVTFVTVNSDWRQGVRIDTDGSLDVDGETIKKAVLLWYDTAPHEVPITVYTKKGELWVKNVWDTGRGIVESWHNGAAMIVEEIPNGRLYKCNDGKPDDDFDDLIFSIELVE